MAGPRPRSLTDRLMDKVQIGQSPTACWLWTGSLRAGYGQIRVRTETGWTVAAAHRVSYELARGPIPDGLDLDHLCRNTVCVNPRHLEPVTRQTNVLRGVGPSATNARKTNCGRCGLELVAIPSAYRYGPALRHCPACQPLGDRGLVTLTCEVCEKPFQAKKSTALTCSTSCRSRKARTKAVA